MQTLLRSSAIVMTALTCLAAGCAHDASEKPSAMVSPPPVITYNAHDYAFEGPESIPGGFTTIRLVNRGHELHQIQLLKLEEGRTADDFPKNFPGSTSLLPKWIKHMGGPNGIIPGEETTATIYLEPGQYVLICEIPDQQMTPHVVRGMLKPVTVTTSIGLHKQSAKEDSEVTLIDFGFTVTQPLTHGRHTIKVGNQGHQPHELVLVQLPPGASAKDFVAAFAPGASGPAPGKPIGGMNALEEGGEGTFTADIVPGNYAYICFKIDPDSRAPHFAKGMMMDFSVR
jgi:hypothetical protein